MRRGTPARRTAVAALALLLGACMVRVPEPPASAPAVIDANREVAAFVALANRARLDAGCGTIVWHEEVASVAQAHSADMRARDYFDHVNPEGRTPMQRVQAAGIGVLAVAENIALGQPTGAAVFESWRDSPGHRRNLLNCEYTHHGVGLSGAHWTHVLVRLR